MPSRKLADPDQTRNSGEFGVYILTYPGDYHLSLMLVRSIQQVSPDIPIMIIPGEGFDHQHHPFDVPIMPIPAGFWGEIGHQDRCFWAFQGPFETFLYLDADMICTKSLEDLRRRITQQQGNFIYIHTFISDQDWLALIHDPAHASPALRQDLPRGHSGARLCAGPCERGRAGERPSSEDLAIVVCHSGKQRHRLVDRGRSMVPERWWLRADQGPDAPVEKDRMFGFVCSDKGRALSVLLAVRVPAARHDGKVIERWIDARQTRLSVAAPQ